MSEINALLKDIEPDGWVVVSEDGYYLFASKYKETSHDYINYPPLAEVNKNCQVKAFIVLPDPQE